MKLAVLTAVSRPDNLPAIAESLATAAESAPNVTLSWHWRFDPLRLNVGGQALKNAMLEEIRGGFVWCLDDDTVAHPDVLRIVSDASVEHPKAKAIIVSQRRTDGRVLLADPAWMQPGGVDIGQAFLRRSLIGDERIPLDYNGDGMFLQTVLAQTTPLYLLDIVSLHNAITGVDVSL